MSRFINLSTNEQKLMVQVLDAGKNDVTVELLRGRLNQLTEIGFLAVTQEQYSTNILLTNTTVSHQCVAHYNVYTMVDNTKHWIVNEVTNPDGGTNCNRLLMYKTQHQNTIHIAFEHSRTVYPNFFQRFFFNITDRVYFEFLYVTAVMSDNALTMQPSFILDKLEKTTKM